MKGVVGGGDVAAEIEMDGEVALIHIPINDETPTDGGKRVTNRPVKEQR